MRAPHVVAFVAFISTVTSTTILILDDRPQPTCIIDLFRPAPLKTDCTFLEHTSTKLVHTECGGCALRTKRVGFGLPCKTVTTVPGTTYRTVIACAEPTTSEVHIHTHGHAHKHTPRLTSTVTRHFINSSTIFPSHTTPTRRPKSTTTTTTTATATATPCTTWVVPQQSSTDTACHLYPDIATAGCAATTPTTAYDGPCVVSTLALGPGPVIPSCVSTVTHSLAKRIRVKGCEGNVLEPRNRYRMGKRRVSPRDVPARREFVWGSVIVVPFVFMAGLLFWWYFKNVHYGGEKWTYLWTGRTKTHLHEDEYELRKNGRGGIRPKPFGGSTSSVHTEPIPVQEWVGDVPTPRPSRSQERRQKTLSVVEERAGGLEVE